MCKRLKTIIKQNIFLLGLVIFSICAIVFYILYCTKAHFHSDLAYWLLLADEQIKNKQFYPDGFHYTTGVPTISTELLVLVIRLFCSDWLLSREFAVIIIVAILFILIAYFYKNILEKDNYLIATCISIVLLCLPMEHYRQTYYEAAYTWQIIWDILLILSINRIIVRKGEAKKYPFSYIGLFIVVFFNSMSTKNILVFILPLLLSILVYSFIENQYHFECIFKNKKYNFIFFISILGVVLGYLSYLLIAKKVELDSVTGGTLFVSIKEVGTNFNSLFLNIIDFYSAVKPGALISINGITACINLIIMIICAIIAPFWMIRNYKNQNSFWKIYTLYSMTSNLFVLYTMVFTNANYARYLQPVFWHNIVFTSLWIINILKNKDKYYKSVIFASLAIAVILGHLCYAKNTVIPIRNQHISEKTNGTLVDFLKKNNLNYGFATFWNAYNNMAFSNGEITFAAYKDSPLIPFYWMTSDSYYDVNKHPGRCFILLGPEETVDTKFHLAASETKQYNGYTILIYDKNIHLYPELQ